MKLAAILFAGLAAAAAGQSCGYQWFFVEGEDCTSGYALALNTCYQASSSVAGVSGNYIMAPSSSSFNGLQAWGGSAGCVGNPAYSSALSSSCGVCYPVNPLVDFILNGYSITSHGLSGPPNNTMAAVPLPPQLAALPRKLVPSVASAAEGL